MTDQDADAAAYQIICVSMPASWVEKCDFKGNVKMTPKAKRLRNAIAKALIRAYKQGADSQKAATAERGRP